VLPATAIAFNNASLAPFQTGDAIAGGFNPTVSQMYDPLAAAAIPSIAPDVVIVELNYSATQDKINFGPVIPSGGGVPNNQLSNDNTGFFMNPKPALSLLYNLAYSVNAGPTLQFPTPCVAQSTFAEVPVFLAAIQGAGGQAFNTNVYMRGALLLTGLLPTDQINFQLYVYTQYIDQVIDNTGASGGNFLGSVSVKTSMIRI